MEYATLQINLWTTVWIVARIRRTRWGRVMNGPWTRWGRDAVSLGVPRSSRVALQSRGGQEHAS
jgi:hypothetical protein